MKDEIKRGIILLLIVLALVFAAAWAGEQDQAHDNWLRSEGCTKVEGSVGMQSATLWQCPPGKGTNR